MGRKAELVRITRTSAQDSESQIEFMRHEQLKQQIDALIDKAAAAQARVTIIVVETGEGEAKKK